MPIERTPIRSAPQSNCLPGAAAQRRRTLERAIHQSRERPCSIRHNIAPLTEVPALQRILPWSISAAVIAAISMSGCDSRSDRKRRLCAPALARSAAAIIRACCPTPKDRSRFGRTIGRSWRITVLARVPLIFSSAAAAASSSPPFQKPRGRAQSST